MKRKFEFFIPAFFLILLLAFPVSASVVIYDFDTSDEGWAVRWSAGGTPGTAVQIEAPSYDGDGSLKVPLSADGEVWHKAGVSPEGSFDFSAYANQIFTVQIYVSSTDNPPDEWIKNEDGSESGYGLRAQMFAQWGADWSGGYWDDPWTLVEADTWVTLSMPANIIGDLTDVKRLGVQVGCGPKDGITDAGFEGWEGSVYIDHLTASAVPIPGTFILFGSGLFGLIGLNRKRKSRKSSIIN